MPDFTQYSPLPRLREVYADGPKAAARANAEIVAQLTARRKKIDPQIGAFCPKADLPLPAAGPLAGLPLTIKDQYHLAGARLGFGFGKLADRPSNHDASAIAALRKNGAHFVGRTNMPPLALDFQTVDGTGHRTNNPYDQRLTAGGSSGGGAAAVATGMSLVDIGADLSGSLRIPASFCGVMSLLPTDGQFSNQGMLLDEAQHLAHFARPGVIGRDADDLWITYRFMQGDEAVPGPLAQMPKTDLKLGWIPEADSHPLARRVQAVFDHWQGTQAANGVQFADFDMDLFQADLRRDFAFLMGYETGGMLPWMARLAVRLFGRDAAKRSPDFLAQVHKGYGRSKSAYAAALARRAHYIETALSAFGDLEALVVPVTPMPAFTHISPISDQNGVRDYDHQFCVDNHAMNYFDGLTYYTGAISLLGFPVVTMPLGFTPEGLPVGAQLVGRPDEEGSLLAVAAALSA